MTKKDQEQLTEIISNEISKHFHRLETRILEEVVSDSMAELVKLSLLEVFDELEGGTNSSNNYDDNSLTASNDISWAFKVYGGSNFVPMSTKQFLNSINTITTKALNDNIVNRAAFTNHDSFVEALNIPNARNAQVYALKQIYDLIRWSDKNDSFQGRIGQIGEA